LYDLSSHHDLRWFRLVDDGNDKESDEDVEEDAATSTDEEDVPGWDITVGDGERAFRVRKMPKGHQHRFVVDDKGMIGEVKALVTQGFKLNERADFLEENYMLVYGGLPLGDDWHVSDMPVDAFKLELWDKEDTHAAALRAEKSEMEKKIAKAQAVLDKEAGFEARLCDEHNRKVAILMLKWNDEKNLKIIEWSETEKQDLEDGNTFLEDMIAENKFLEEEVTGIEKLMVKHADPLGFAEKMQKQWEHEELLAQLEDRNDDDAPINLDFEAASLKILRDREIEQHAKQFISDFYIFLFFITVFSFGFFLSRVGNPGLYFYGAIIRNMIEDDLYKNIVDQTTMWKYLNESLIPNLYATHTYTGAPIPEAEHGFVLRYNRMLGGMRFRQVRGSDTSCAQTIKGLESLKTCYAYEPETPDMNPLIKNRPRTAILRPYLPTVVWPPTTHFPNGTLRCPECNPNATKLIAAPTPAPTVNIPNATNATPHTLFDPNATWVGAEKYVNYRFHAMKELGDPPMWTRGVLAYPGTGMIQDIPATKPLVARAMVDDLIKMGWTDWNTRAMFVDFSLYNAGTNQFVIVRIMFEISNSGAVITNLYYNTVKLFRYATALDIIVLLFETQLLIMQCVFLNSNYQKVKRVGVVNFVRDFWMTFDLVNNLILFVVFFIRATWLVGVLGIDFGKVQKDEYVDLISIASQVTTESKVNAFNALMMFMRVFRFMNLDPFMAVFRSTLERASQSLAAFWSMLILVMLAVASACFVAFGRQVAGFRTLMDAIISLFRYSAGDYNFKEMAEVQPFLGPLFTLSYMVLIYFCLMNMFMSILAECYAAEIRSGSAASDELMAKIRADLYRTMEHLFPYFERQRIWRELEVKRLQEIKRGIIVEDHEMLAARFLFKKLVGLAGQENALVKMKGYEEDLDPLLPPWVPRTRFLEMTALLEKLIDQYELMASKKGKEAVRQIFMKVDEDGSGFIEADEVEHMADNLRIAMSDDEKLDLLMIVEEQCAGAMNFDEFYAWYMRFKPTEAWDESREEELVRVGTGATNAEDDIELTGNPLAGASGGKEDEGLLIEMKTF